MTTDPTDNAEVARRFDRDRFLSALFVPAAQREAAFALIAFNHELARAVELPSARSGAGPIATLIRLQWWREVVEGERADWRSHPVAVSIRRLVEEGRVSVATLKGLVAAREAEAEGVETLEAWRTTMLEGPGGLQHALAEIVGVPSALLPRVAAAGAAYGCGALRLHLESVLRAGRCPLPDDLLAEAGTDREALLHDPRPEPRRALQAALAQQGRLFLDAAGVIRLPRAQIAAALPLALAERDLARDLEGPGRPAQDRGIGDRLAVLRAYASGRAGARR